MKKSGTFDGCDRVSIVVPVYNSEGTLDHCLQCITGQSFTNIEIIIVDDGSTDSSRAICHKWMAVDKRIKVISQKNAGPSAARNLGYKYANGKWIWFIDSDDFIVPSAVETLVSRAGIDDSDVVICDFDVIDGKTTKSREFIGLRSFPRCTKADSKHFLEDILSRSIGNYVWQFLIKKAVLRSMGERGPFDESLTLYEDVVFSLRLAATANLFCYVNEICYHYQMTQGSLVHTIDPDLARQALRAVDYLDGLAVPEHLAVLKLENILTLLLGAGITAGISKDSRAVLSEIKSRIQLLQRDRNYRGISGRTKLKCLAINFNLYWLVTNFLNIRTACCHAKKASLTDESR